MKPQVLVFNFNKYLHLPARKGSLEDLRKLKSCLSKLCNIKSYYDLTASDFHRKLRELAAIDYSSCRYLLVVISCHGQPNDFISTRDTEVSLAAVIRLFSDVQCPKIFVVQACRGYTYDPGSIEEKAFESAFTCHFTNRAANDNILLMSRHLPPNCVLAYSTPPSRFSWRGQKKGGYFMLYFIETLKRFESEKRKLDILEVLVATNAKLASEFKSRGEIAGMRQVGHFISTLEERLCLD